MGDRFNALIIAPRFDAQRLAQQVAADKGWTCNWRLVEAPGIPHDHERMFNHPQCAVAMFGDAADYKRVADSDSSRNAEGYQRPPTAITKILNAPPTPIVSFSPNRKTMLFVERASYPPIEDLAAPMLRLGGLRGETSNLGAREHYVEHLVVDPVSGAVIDATAGGVVNLTDRDGEQQSLQHGAPIVGLVSLRNGTFVTAGADGLVKCWQLNPPPLALADLSAAPARDSANGDVLAFLDGGKRLSTFPAPAGIYYKYCTFSSDGKRVFVTGNDSKVHILDTELNEELIALTGGVSVGLVDMSSDDLTLAYAGWQGCNPKAG